MVVPQPLNYTDKKILVASFPTDSENCKQEPRIFVLDPPRPCPGVMHTNSILRIFTVLVPSVFKIFFRYACVFVNRLYFPLVHSVPRWPWQDNRRVALNFFFFFLKKVEMGIVGNDSILFDFHWFLFTFSMISKIKPSFQITIHINSRF